MRQKVVIRDCKKEDLGGLQSLVEELYLTDAGPHADIPDASATYRALKARPSKGRVLVFEKGGWLVGYAIIIFFWSNEFGGDIVDIDEILVTKAHRGEGVGSAFFAWLEKEYAERAAGWSLQVKPSNKKALKLYKNVGFRTSSNWHMYNIFAWNETESNGRAPVQRRTRSTGVKNSKKPATKSGATRRSTAAVSKVNSRSTRASKSGSRRRSSVRSA